MSRAVIDQPGIRIIVVGLALSVFLGLAIRAQISESRIQTYLNRTIDRLQKEFTVDYGSARVNLSSWGLPLPALLIQNIRLSPKGALCQNSQLFVDELEVPISVSAILGLSNKVPKIRARSVELRLTDIESCLNQQSKRQTGERQTLTPAAPISGAAPPPQIRSEDANVESVFSKQTRAELKEIDIERLKIVVADRSDQPLLFRQMNVDFTYSENRLRVINVTSKLNALRDSKSDLFYLNANVTGVFKSDESNQVESLLDIKGKLLDGDAHLFLHAFSGSGKVSYEFALDRVSHRAVLPFVKLQEGTQPPYAFDKLTSSLSLSSTGEVFLSGPLRVESKFKNIQLNIGDGVLKVDHLSLVHQKGKTKVNPFVMVVGNLSLTHLKNNSDMKKVFDSFESLGQLSGSLAYTDEQTYRFHGDVRNIQAVFSNRGRRDLQNIDQVNLRFSRSGQELRVSGTEFIVGGQSVSGKFDANYNYENYRTQAQLKLSGKMFNDKIWEQFTYVEQSPQIDILWNYRKQKTETHSLKIAVESLALPGIELNKLNISLNQELADTGSGNSVMLSIRPARVIANQSFLDHPVVSQILNARYGFKLKALTSTRTNLTFSGRDWQNIGFQLESHFLSDLNLRSETHLTLKGVAEYGKGLMGRLTLQGQKQTARFELQSEPEGGIRVSPLR